MSDEALESLRALHDNIDRDAAHIAARHGRRIECRSGCNACCVDNLSVFEIEAQRIRRDYPDVLAEPAHPSGACALLDDNGACRVYSARPFVCRTQGLPLRWYEEVVRAGDEEGEIEVENSICELNAEGPSLESLADRDVWTLGPTELELQRLQERFAGNQRRVALRSLFDPS